MRPLVLCLLLGACAAPTPSRPEASIHTPRGDTLYFRTTRDAPNGRVVAIDVAAPTAWRTVVPESEHLLQHARLVGDRIVVAWRRDVVSVLEVHGIDDRAVSRVDLPARGSVFHIEGDAADTRVTFSFDSFVHPLSTWLLDVSTGETRRVSAPAGAVDPKLYDTRQVFFRSKDGTRVPMFVVQRRDLGAGPHPTLLHGYGAVGDVNEPMFTPDAFAWVDAGGVYVVANVRGGGEYGRAWHDAGKLANKQSSYDDFAAAAEHLIATGVTSSRHLALHGISNGGMLVGATMTQRPELFAAAVPVAGVLDALRFPLFGAGPNWAREMGDPTDPEQFAWLAGWSPLHRIEHGTCYPATLVLTAINDDVVHASQSLKFAARLQEAQGCGRPTLLRVYPRGGHGIASDVVDPTARLDALTFAAHHTGLGP